MDVDVTILL